MENSQIQYIYTIIVVYVLCNPLLNLYHCYFVNVFSSFICFKMNFNTRVQHSSHTSKENLPPSSKTNPSQVQRPKQRTVLGVLSENEQRGCCSSQVRQRHEASSVAFTRPQSHWLLCVYRGASYPNTVRARTAPGSPSSAISPVPVMTCTLKRLTKSFLQLLETKRFQTAVT